MSMEIFKSTLNAYGQATGIGAMPFDEERGISLAFQPDIQLTLSWGKTDQMVYIYSSCGALPKGDNSELLQALLSANHFWSNTGGATLSLDATNQTIYLIDRWELRIFESAETFSKYIDAIVDTIERWKKRIEDNVYASKSSNYIDSFAASRIKGLEMR